ncbi:hypothetical protein LCGC14_2136990 [marine sediment metagenome]|uniref:Uncharacterized protein n=1 Tax=marine sediment metagenome TaxID=412755 RepID=A0A0F9GVT5_9ZZZZ
MLDIAIGKAREIENVLFNLGYSFYFAISMKEILIFKIFDDLDNYFSKLQS